MLSLVPAWAVYFDEFWKAIRRRNLWFIKLRYGAVFMLLAFLLSSEFLLKITFTPAQVNALTILTIVIFIYNILLHYLRRFVQCKVDGFNPLHFSLVQMVLDLSMLLLLVFYTGSIESPLSMLFLFHMIIGSLILPGRVIYSVAGFIISVYVLLVYGEYFSMLPHHAVMGLLREPLFQNATYLVSSSVVFVFVMWMSVVLANKIAHQLYMMEQKLVESLEQLNTAENEKQRYVMSVVHEIKTPLTALHSYLDVVLQGFLGPLDEKIAGRLERARARSAEAIELTNDVLKVSKLRLLDEIEKSEIDIREICETIIRKLKIHTDLKNISLTMFDNREEKKIIHGDAFLLEIAFSNLLANAVKYTEEEGTIEILLSNENEGMVIEICDNGIGIPETDQSKIFGDFYRASNSKKFEGTGMGLSIIKHIIQQHNGRISFQSPSRLATTSSPGTAFFVFLP